MSRPRKTRRVTTPLSRRLRDVMEHGNMTDRQLAWFFDRPYQTVYTWVFRNREPYPFYANEVMNRLATLERLIGSRCRLTSKGRKPFVPKELLASEREAYVKRVYADARISQRPAAE